MPVGVQPASCEATMRIDNLAHGAGFGAQAPREVSPGEGFHIGVSAGPGVLYGVLAGTPRPVGEMTSSGLLNLLPGWTMFIIRGTDAAGEDTRLYTVPSDVPVGFDVALQVIATTAAGHQLSNPHVLRVVP